MRRGKVCDGGMEESEARERAQGGVLGFNCLSKAPLLSILDERPFDNLSLNIRGHDHHSIVVGDNEIARGDSDTVDVHDLPLIDYLEPSIHVIRQMSAREDRKFELAHSRDIAD